MKRIMLFSFGVVVVVTAITTIALRGSASTNSKSRRPDKRLLMAATIGDADQIKKLLAEGADPNSPVDFNGKAPLHKAAGRGNVNVIEVLLIAGAEVDVQDDSGNTALMEGAAEGRTYVVYLLLEAGADVNHQDNFGSTACIKASWKGYADVVNFLLNAGAQVDVQEYNWGSTALSQASFYGSADVVTLLLNAGASKTLKDKKGETALDIARRRNNLAVVALLTSGG